MNDPESLNEIDAKVFANKSNKEGVSARDHIPQIFICATMWHETKEELVEFLKSILRLDEDQCARRMAMKYIQLNEDEIDKEYYDLESEFGWGARPCYRSSRESSIFMIDLLFKPLLPAAFEVN